VENNSAIAQAHPNIAFIKYWGNTDSTLRIPANGSISMNLASLHTTTRVTKAPHLENDQLILNGEEKTGKELKRVQLFLDQIRKRYHKVEYLKIKSENNFPISAGIASSASAFAALASAAAMVYNLKLSEPELSSLARLGSGSACRSIPPGFCEWKTGQGHNESYAFSFAPKDHWNLWDCIAVIENKAKKVSSTSGHSFAQSSPLQNTRIADTPRRLEICKTAIINKDFRKLANIIELDSNLMHAVMMTCDPPVMYWQPGSISIMRKVREMRQSGIDAAFTLDAGANVHIICPEDSHRKVIETLKKLSGIQEIITSPVGGGIKNL